jgi:hypothetical protein
MCGAVINVALTISGYYQLTVLSPLLFSQRKVMLKLRRMLDKEDFEGLFSDPVIGDWL